MNLLLSLWVQIGPFPESPKGSVGQIVLRLIRELREIQGDLQGVLGA